MALPCDWEIIYLWTSGTIFLFSWHTELRLLLLGIACLKRESSFLVQMQMRNTNRLKDHKNHFCPLDRNESPCFPSKSYLGLWVVVSGKNSHYLYYDFRDFVLLMILFSIEGTQSKGSKDVLWTECWNKPSLDVVHLKMQILVAQEWHCLCTKKMVVWCSEFPSWVIIPPNMN